MLHLTLIAFDEILQQLLVSNGNLEVIHFLLVSLRHIALINVLSDSNIRCKWVIWPPEDVHCIADRRTEQLRVMLHVEFFAASRFADGLRPGSIWFKLVYNSAA